MRSGFMGIAGFVYEDLGRGGIFLNWLKMPPSPSLRALRSSPGREVRMENVQMRRRSFESGLLPLKTMDEDLALFSDVLNKESENFLLRTCDDFEDSISKLSYISDFKLGVKIPVRGESRDLLSTHGEKNDYDWLLTPPDTPLFPFLDDECEPTHLIRGGRPERQAVSVSRPLSSESTRRTRRSSASPQRVSSSPCSTSSLAQLRGRPSSVPRSSPPPVLHSTTHSRRPSTPPNKPSSPAKRSSSPTIRRMSTGSSRSTSSPVRAGTSPTKASRGNSASPKLRGWQASLDGFSANAPSTLRNFLSDRPASYTRGLSSSSTNRMDTLSKLRRQSMSPIASRTTSTTHIQERDLLSTYSKGSAASSGGDDDVDPLHPVKVDMTASINGEIVNNKSMIFSKKASRTSVSSAPKRSFDPALRQIDHHKTPQNMFRPLLSSVPTASYVGKTSNMQRPMFSRKYSLTTCSSASSEQGIKIAPDIEGSDLEYSDLACEWERTLDTDNQDDIFIFHSVDEISEDGCHEIFNRISENNDKKVYAGMPNEFDPQVFETSVGNFGISTALDSSYASSEHSVSVSCEVMAASPICGKQFCEIEMNGNTDSCHECTEKDSYFTSGSSGTILSMHQDEAKRSEILIENDKSRSAHINYSVAELSEKCCTGVKLDQNEISIECDYVFVLNGNPPQEVINQMEQSHSEKQLERLQQENATQNSSENKQQSQYTGPSDLRVDIPEGIGISVLLLQRSSSSKWPFVQGRNFSATNMLCSQPSYARESTDTMKCSIVRDSSSTSSSVDLVVYRQKEDYMQCLLSSKGSEVDSTASYVDSPIQNSDFHSEVFINTLETAFQTECEHEENLSGFMEVVERATFWDIAQSSSVSKDVVHADGHLTTNTSESQLLSQQGSVHLPDTLITYSLKEENCASCVNSGEEVCENSFKSTQVIEVPNEIQDISLTGENHFLNDSSNCVNDKYYDDTKSPPDVILELGNDHNNFIKIQPENMSSENLSDKEASHEPSAFASSVSGVLDSSFHSIIPDHFCIIQEEPYITVEGPRGHVTKSLTLEEAANSILFCSSIIHDLAYKAASIGMEKELLLLEGSCPAVTLLGNYVSKQKDPRNLSDKNMPKSQKCKRKELETNSKAKELETNIKATELVNNVKVAECIHSNEGIPDKPNCLKPPKLESKCNCTIM